MPAHPGPWPIAGGAEVHRIAVLAIDLQRDFVDPDGWFGALGFDLSDCRRALVQTRLLVRAARVAGVRVILTRQGNAADLSDLPGPRRAQGRQLGNPIGTPGPLGRALIRGERGWELTDGLGRGETDIIIDKPGFSCFHGTDLDATLRGLGVTSLIVCGVTANVCVLATIYAAVDRGYDCLTVTDAVGASTGDVRRAATSFVEYQGGLFGRTATTADVVSSLVAVEVPER